ncbi:ABC transporter ATP-binding protein [Tropicimonas sp. IMCC6043]|uniref:ABC transporter ATP-binding protein n=1 Tax=Tropicimonas sp. IMCC6043 TaxID=2510645 RepID=UPI00101C9CEF|nr:ATP-binding cassette domain-containing protein [Tropicimonas sp. IMCC6043]RYH10817.1 ATP-binding cassette domain-containing protein [Tropicimonas sp. IMCC6043]
MSMAALGFDGIAFAYGATAVLEDIGFDVPTGRVTALMGPSGCGKSTLMLLAAGLLSPNAGEVERRCRRSAIMFQDPLLLPWRTALANVAFALKAEGLPAAERRDRAAAMLARVGLTAEDATKFPRQLSGGMRQRVALARALVVEPDLLLLDEPFGALDAQLARQMHALVRDQVEQDGATALLITHDAQEAARIAERIVLLTSSPGRVALVRDPPQPVRQRGKGEIASEAQRLLACIG